MPAPYAARPPDLKVPCTKCQVPKFPFDFRRRKSGKYSGEYFTTCHQCEVQYKREYRIKHPEVAKFHNQKRGPEYHRQHLYGLSDSDFRALESRQKGVCALCGKKPKKFHVDHDHATGKIRGLLCIGCNTGLGQLGDNEAGLRRALTYITKGIQ